MLRRVSQVVRQRVLIPLCKGSNPLPAANDNKRKPWLKCLLNECGGLIDHDGIKTYWRYSRCGKILR